MNQKVIWLISLLFIWTAAAVLWMGFTLPKMTGYTPGFGDGSGRPGSSFYFQTDSNANERNLFSPPPSLNSPVNSKRLLADRKLVESWKNWVQQQSQGNPVRLVVTGYQLTEESANTAMGRAKGFKNLFEKNDFTDFILVEEYRDNLIEKNGVLQDVIGISLVKYLPDRENNLLIETTPDRIKEEKERIQRMAVIIRASKGHFLELNYCTSKAYEALENNRSEIRKLKDELNEIGIPRHKIIGNLQECESVKPIVQLKIK
jgi:hypothetical protein